MNERDDRALIYLALKIMGLTKHFDDYYDVGLVGLAKGIKTYDESKGTKRSTFYMECILNELKKEIIHLRAKKNIGAFNTISLNKILDENAYNETELGELIKDPNVDVEKQAITNVEMDNVRYCMDKYLTAKQREYINDYYFKGMTTAEMAKERNVSRQSVYNYIKNIIKILRKNIDRSRQCNHEVVLSKKDPTLEEMLELYM